MDAAGNLRHGAARDLAVVAAVRVLEHELELVRVPAVARHVVRGDLRVNQPVIGRDSMIYALAATTSPTDDVSS